LKHALQVRNFPNHHIPPPCLPILVPEGTITLTVYSYTLRETDTFFFIASGVPARGAQPRPGDATRFGDERRRGGRARYLPKKQNPRSPTRTVHARRTHASANARRPRDAHRAARRAHRGGLEVPGTGAQREGDFFVVVEGRVHKAQSSLLYHIEGVQTEE
jgi:hypothetical protein